MPVYYRDVKYREETEEKDMEFGDTGADEAGMVRLFINIGKKNKAKPGDIICYSGHVAIYMGNNKVVHASNPRDGIKITKGAAYRSIVTIRRVF